MVLVKVVGPSEPLLVGSFPRHVRHIAGDEWQEELRLEVAKRVGEVGTDSSERLGLSGPTSDIVTATFGEVGRGAATGRPAELKAEQYWALSCEAGGEVYCLRPIHGWYEFDSVSCSDGIRVKTLEQGEAEMKRESGVRKEITDKSDAVFSRHAARYGAKGKSRSQILHDLRLSRWLNRDEKLSSKDQRFLERLRALEVLEASGGDGVLSDEAELADETAAPDVLAPPKQPQGQEAPCLCLDTERLEDATGLRKQMLKLKKALKRKAAAIEGAEDEEVPATANALLALKSERGEGLWDFVDGEEFSDDEPEPNVFEDQHATAADDNGDGVLSGDEDAEDVERGDQLTSHGKHLERLLRLQDEEDSALPVNPLRANARALAQKDAVRKKDAATPMTSASSSSQAPVVAAVATDAAPFPPPQAAAEDMGSGPVDSPQAADSGAKGPSLRDRALECLRQRQGQCSLADAAAALGLKSQNSPLYRQVVAALREVADVQRIPGEARPLLVLKALYRGSLDPALVSVADSSK